MWNAAINFIILNPLCLTKMPDYNSVQKHVNKFVTHLVLHIVSLILSKLCKNEYNIIQCGIFTVVYIN